MGDGVSRMAVTNERRVLDTSILINHWRRRQARSFASITVADVQRWARELVELYRTDAIVTPVYLEFIAGVASRHEYRLARAYLAVFRCIDQGTILPSDWVTALQLAARVPRDGKP